MSLNYDSGRVRRSYGDRGQTIREHASSRLTSPLMLESQDDCFRSTRACLARTILSERNEEQHQSWRDARIVGFRVPSNLIQAQIHNTYSKGINSDQVLYHTTGSKRETASLNADVFIIVDFLLHP